MGIVKEKLPRILFIMHMPPPVHGAAMVGKYIHDSRLVNEAFDCRYINLATAANLEDIGKVRLAKFVDFSRLLRRIRKEYMTVPIWYMLLPMPEAELSSKILSWCRCLNRWGRVL